MCDFWMRIMDSIGSFRAPVRLCQISCMALCFLLSQNVLRAERGQLKNLLTPPEKLHAPVTAIKLGAPIHRRFDLNSQRELKALLQAVDAALEQAEAQEDEWKARKKAMEARKPRTLMTQAELRAYHTEPSDLIPKRDKRGFAELKRLGEKVLNTPASPERVQLVRLMVEVANAIHNNHRAPVPRVIEALQVPYSLYDYTHNPIAAGDKLSANLASAFRGRSDFGRIDPLPSSFWARPEDIGSQDLYHGFGRSSMPAFQEPIWEYKEPKTSYGCCGGFEAESGKKEIKVKFCETTSEPFTSRIFGALGYNVEATDYVPWLRLRYDRRLFLEYHMRKDVKTSVRFFGVIPAYTVNMQSYFDPFDAIATAVMKDGSRVNSSEFKRMLFKRPGVAYPERRPGNFKEEVEQQVDYLITRPANVQIKESRQHTIGPWDFNQLGHENLRELRGAGLLGAWLGWFDSRYENTRLKTVKQGDTVVLKHFFTDLGGGMGRSIGIFSRTAERPNQFAWKFTSAPRRQGHGRMTIPFRVVNYQPNEDTDAFAEMTIDDARWMARLIGQLTENQILEALVAAGFDSAQARLYAEKLVARRDQMIRDLGLEGEVPLLRPRGADRSLTYNPSQDGIVRAKLPNGKEIVARPGPSKVEKGLITPWPPPVEDLAPKTSLAEQLERDTLRTAYERP